MASDNPRMIRRAAGDDFLLVTQHDHALLSGELAEQCGNEYFAHPEPREPVITGVRLHDCGWPLHDDEPTLNKTGLPLDVFETPRDIALKVWQTSVDRAIAKDPYAGLLVSLHVLSLSVFVTTQASFMQEKWELERGPQMFAVSKFQQNQVERQESLRLQLGLRNDRSTESREATQKSEDQLNFNFRMLQAMDLISLAACCTKPPTSQTQDVMPQPGAAPIRLHFARQDNDVIVDPWPFGVAEIELKIPVCRVSAKPFESREAFVDAWKTAPAEILTSRIIPS
jgi:uncharacterized protein DUF3891